MVTCDTDIIKKGLIILENKDYEGAIAVFADAEKFYREKNEGDKISVTLSLMGMSKYLLDRNNYNEALKLLNDARYMAQYSKSDTAKLVNEYAQGTLYFGEGMNDVALIHFDNAKNISMNSGDELSIMGYVLTRIKQIRNGMDFSLPITSDPLVSLVKIGRSITAVTDIDVLLKVIAEETKIAIQADRCTVFMLDKEKNELWSKVALGMDSQEIRFPADKGLAGYVVKTGEPLNIPDAYNDPRFNPDIDKETGYRTKTILCMPIKNNNQEIIGAFQVLNKLSGVFTKGDEDLLVAIGGSASIALENAQLFEQQKELYKEQKILFESFIDTLATSIDARDKITAGHSSRVKLYSMLIVDELGCDSKFKELVEKAAILHDIGKIGIRDSVLQKEGKLTDDEYKHIQEHVRITHDILEKIHTSDDFKMITEIACSHHEKYDGSGYYRHLSGEDIPYGGRILAVADVFDAITSRRHYRDKMPIQNVIDILLSGKNKHFDGNLVDAFLRISVDKIIRVFLTENHNSFKDEDCETLSHYNLLNIHDYIVDENASDEQKHIADLFNFYYSGNINNREGC
ncbi:metal dependent phosphohydrolase with GAF sensor [Fusobacterium sp. CAG:439]|nr:metal dependent phosphohydrolase with GAF sensor [Fusobacterium sp. CAG:439]